MAQFKEYFEKDFLYSGSYLDFDANDCNKTNVQWDDLIQESCNAFSPGTTSITINGKLYTVTINGTVNTIREIAEEFTKQTPYNFSYDSSNNLIIDDAKITFNSTTTKSASDFLGFSSGDVRKLPYTLPNAIKISANSTAASQYVFDLCYNIPINNGKIFDIRATNGNAANIYFEDKSLTSGLTNQTGNPYVNNIQLIQHLNKKKVGYETNGSDPNRNGKCFYRFDYDYNLNKLIVSDLVLYDSLQVTTVSDGTKTIEITVKTTTVDGSTISNNYIYEFIRPNYSSGSIYAESINDIVENSQGGKFRNFDFTSDTVVNNNGTPNDSSDDTTTYSKQKIIAPSVKQKTTDGSKITYGGSISGVYANGLFVCDLCNTALPNNFVNSKLPTFKIAFDSISGDPIVMCSGTKFVKIEGDYYTLPYTKLIENGNAAGGDCEKQKRNKAICDNKKSAKTIMDKSKTHPGFNQQYIDAKGFSDMSVLNVINLGIGIVAAAVFIAKAYK